MTHKTFLGDQKVRWTNTEVTLSPANRRYCPPRPDEYFRREQLPFLAAVCLAASKGALRFFTSFELEIEEWRQRWGREGYLGVNWLRDAVLERVDGPLPTDAFSVTRESISKEGRLDYFRSISHPRFLQIRTALGDAHPGDAFHLWTAEVARLDVFLTMDQKFLRVIQQCEGRLGLLVSTMSPKDLCGRLDISPVDVDVLASQVNPHA